MQSKATTVKEYLAALPPDRREAIQAVRKVILENLDGDYEEGIGYGMLSYHIPHSVYPAGYHCNPKLPVPFCNVASQKNHMAVYLMCVYGVPGQEEWFRKAWAKTGKKLDMGKSCIRFKRLEDVALDVIGEAVRRTPAAKFLAYYEEVLDTRSGGGGMRPAAKRAAKKTAKKAAKKAGKKTAKKATKKTAKKTAKKSAKKTAGKRVTKQAVAQRSSKKVTKRSAKKTTKKKAAKKTAKKGSRRS